MHRRQQLIILLGEGLPLNEIAKRLNVSYDTIIDDKKYITKQGVKFLNSIGNKEISFYYQTIIADMNHIKNDLWGIIKKDYSDETLVNQYLPRDKIQAYRLLKEINTEFREIFKEALSLFTIEEQSKRIASIEKQLGIIDQGNNITNYFNQGLPKLDQD